MSDLYNKINSLCSENGINITQMCKKTGVSRGSLTDLKSGRSSTLSQKALSKIAEHFNTSVDYLLGKSIDEQLTGVDFALQSETQTLTDEQKQSVLNYVKFLKSQE